MKKLVLILTLLTLNCNSQEGKVIELVEEEYSEMKYIFARILPELTVQKELYNGGVFLTIFLISDSKATPEEFSPGTEEFLNSYFISITEDGDYYSGSKLHKIEGLINPKILEIKETKYPEFYIKIEHGFNKNLRFTFFDFKGLE